MTETPEIPDPATAPADPAEEARAAREEALRGILALEPGERLERLYLFEPLERKDVAFSLALVTKRLGPGRLEMVAIGARGEPGRDEPAPDFIRRARFPESVLPSILEEFIDRCGVEGAVYRETDLTGRGRADADRDPFARLAEALAPGAA